VNSVFAFTNLLTYPGVVALVFFLILKALIDNGSLLWLLIIHLKTFQKTWRKCKAAGCLICLLNQLTEVTESFV